MKRVVGALRCRYIIASFSNEGYLPREEMEDLLRSAGDVRVVEVDFKRYVGAQIGIYNPSGRKVGSVRNKEYLFVVGVNGSPLPKGLGDVARAGTAAQETSLL